MFQPLGVSGEGEEAVARAAQGAIRSGECDAVVFFPADFGRRVDEARTRAATRGARGQAPVDPLEVPRPQIFFDTFLSI